MTNEEFSNAFDTLLNSYKHRAEFGDQGSIADVTVDEYEKSIFLTQAQDNIVKNYFQRTLNSAGDGFDDSTRRQMDYSTLITVKRFPISAANKGAGFSDNGYTVNFKDSEFMVNERKCYPLFIINERVTAGVTPTSGIATYSSESMGYNLESLFKITNYNTKAVKFAFSVTAVTSSSTPSEDTSVTEEAPEETVSTLSDVEEEETPTTGGTTAGDATTETPSTEPSTEDTEGTDNAGNAVLTSSNISVAVSDTENLVTITTTLVSERDGETTSISVSDIIEALNAYKKTYSFTIEKLFTDNSGNIEEIDSIGEVSLAAATVTGKNSFVVIPINYKEYDRMMSRAYCEPLKRQAWRLFEADSSDLSRQAELILRSDVSNPYQYIVRYVRRPTPIVLADLSNTDNDLTIDGVQEVTPCELNPIIHQEILQEAVRLALASNGIETNEMKAMRASQNK